MTYTVTLTDGTVLEVKVYRACSEEEARERVGHFYPDRKIDSIEKQ